MKIISGFFKVLDKICFVFNAAGFGAIVGILGLQIILRLFGTPFMWAEELCRYIFIWLMFIGGARAFSRGGHLTVDILFIKFPKKMQLILLFIYYVIIIGFSGFLFMSGVQYAKFQWRTVMFTLPSVKLGIIDLCVPIGSALTIIYVLRELYFMIILKEEYLEKKGGALG